MRRRPLCRVPQHAGARQRSRAGADRNDDPADTGRARLHAMRRARTDPFAGPSLPFARATFDRLNVDAFVMPGPIHVPGGRCHPAFRRSATMKHRLACAVVAAAAICTAAFAHRAEAHGFAGARFFPATIQTDDPFVADEGSLPTITWNPTAAGRHRRRPTTASIWPSASRPISGSPFSEQWRVVRPGGAPSVSGWDALTTGQQYQLFVDGKHEAMGLIGLQETWGHTGGKALGQSDFTTLSPTFDFGKGMGDLPDSMRWLRPFAITGNLSVDFPTKLVERRRAQSRRLQFWRGHRIQPPVPAKPGQEHRAWRALRPDDATGRNHQQHAAQSRCRRRPPASSRRA